MKYYLLYGFTVASELTLEEAFEIELPENLDVTIRLCPIPEEMKACLEREGMQYYTTMYNKDNVLSYIPEVAIYLVNKSEICVELLPDADMALVRAYLLGMALGYYIFLKDAVAIHGGGLVKNGKGIIVTGESGAGKSTVSCGLYKRGFDFVADDVCVLTDNKDRLHIEMAYPQQKLCRDAAIRLGYDLSELIYVDEMRDKFACRLKERYLPEGHDLDYIFEIVLSEEGDLSFEELKGHAKLFAVLNNLYKGKSGSEMWGTKPEYMSTCIKLANTVKVYRIYRPNNQDTLEDIMEFIEANIQE